MTDEDEISYPKRIRHSLGSPFLVCSMDPCSAPTIAFLLTKQTQFRDNILIYYNAMRSVGAHSIEWPRDLGADLSERGAAADIVNPNRAEAEAELFQCHTIFLFPSLSWANHYLPMS